MMYNSNTIAFVIVAGLVLVYIIYKSFAQKKQEAEAQAMVPQLLDQYKNEVVFFCDFADYIDGNEEYIQMQGSTNGPISLNTKVLDFNGAEHTIGEIYSVSKRKSLPNVIAGERVTLSVSCGNWNGGQRGRNLPTYSPELQQVRQKIDNDKLVVLKLK